MKAKFLLPLVLGHDAMALRVAGVIVKPYRSSQHAARLLDLALRRMNVKARRSSPRFAIPETMSAVLGLSGSDGEVAFPLKNISESGATIDLDSRSVGSLIEPGRFFPLAALSWGDVQLEAAVDVVHSDTRTAGIRFSRIFEGAPRFHRAGAVRKDDGSRITQDRSRCSGEPQRPRTSQCFSSGSGVDRISLAAR